jgi:hypothetical protein
LQVLQIADVKDAELQSRLEALDATVAALEQHPELPAEREAAAAAAAELRRRVAAQGDLEAALAAARELPDGPSEFLHWLRCCMAYAGDSCLFCARSHDVVLEYKW